MPNQMLSPFHGMDPYLEGYHWMERHIQFCAEITRQLPTMHVPLLPGDADCPLDLQQAFTTI
jgi:hypothetical protein